MINKKKIQIIVSLLVSIFVAIFVGGYLTNLENLYSTRSEKVSVIIAKKYIDRQTPLTQDIVEQIKVPKEYCQPQALQSPDELTPTDKNIPIYIAAIPILEGEQIVSTKLFTLGQQTGLATVIPTDKRVFTVICDRANVSGIIRPGNKVDVIVTFDEETRTILQNITVLAVGRQIFGSLTPYKETKKTKTLEFAQADFIEEDSELPVSLAVTPEEVQLLALAFQKGKISFSLRPLGDEKILNISPISMKKIGSTANIPETHLSNTSNNMLKSIQKQYKEATEFLKKYQDKK